VDAENLNPNVTAMKPAENTAWHNLPDPPNGTKGGHIFAE
jgi:hypothetical protein